MDPAHGAHGAGAHADTLYFSRQLAHLHGVSGQNRPFHDENDARYEVVDDILKPETDADAERAG